MNPESLLKEIDNLKSEIEKDKTELVNVPERFQVVAESAIETKTNRIIELENNLKEIYESEKAKRLQDGLAEFQQTVDKFINSYHFKFNGDKEIFLSTVLLKQDGNKLIAVLPDVVYKPVLKIRKKYTKERLIVHFPDGNEFSENKAPDTFAKAIKEIGITKVKALKISIYGLSLISSTKSNKYSQKKISKNCYLMTSCRTEKKKEILDYISDNLNLNLKVKIK